MDFDQTGVQSNGSDSLNEDVLTIIKIADSIESDPSQFHININIEAVGQRVTSYGGTGLNVSVIGGEAGSTTIGQTVSVDGSKIEIMRDAGNEAVKQQMDLLVSKLRDIANELQKPSREKGRLKALLDDITGKWVPSVISSVVAQIIARHI